MVYLLVRVCDLTAWGGEFKSPFLFKKHMQRERITLEAFSLVTASKQDYLAALD